MADKKISQLTALSAANVASATDVLAIVDTSATETKKITAKDLIDGALNGGTANGVLYLNGSKVATSGTALAFDGTNLGVGGTSGYETANRTTIAAAGVNSALLGFKVGGTSAGYAFADASHVEFGAPTGRYLSWDINGEKMRLDSSGSLGLGVTPSASSVKTFEIASAGNTLSGLGGGDIALMSNAYYNSGFKYAGSNLATSYRQQDGVHKWNIAASGTAGNAISFTQAMTLDADGDLSLGTTSPTAFISGDETTLTIKGKATSYASAITLINNAGTITAGYGVGNTVGAYFGTSSNHPVLFQTNATERARITSGGYFKASNDGTYNSSTGAYHELRQTAADNCLYASNTNAAPEGIAIRYVTDSNGTGNVFLNCVGNATQRAAIRSNGGLANYQSNNADLSDARTKKDIAPAASMWGKVAALEIVAYKYNDQTHDDVNLGVIAQQVESVEPVWVDNDGWGDETPEDGVPLKTVYTKDITFAAIKALQEAMARIESLEAKVAELEAK